MSSRTHRTERTDLDDALHALAGGEVLAPNWLERLRQSWRRLDGRSLLSWGPRGTFTDEEWQKLAPKCRLSPAYLAFAVLNAIFLSFFLSTSLDWAGWSQRFAVLLPVSLTAVACGAAIWVRPTRKRMWWTILLLAAPVSAYVGFTHGFKQGATGNLSPYSASDEALDIRLNALALFIAYATWALTHWRHAYLKDWLHDQALYERALDLSRRLATAQIQPHFLFNSLASLQYWVQQRDDRAAPMLESLTAYLRATLPLFDRPLLSVGEEAQAVRRYLEVMQARLGERLRFSLSLEPAAEQALLPPGVLLTLVENAMEHGVQPQLSGGRIDVIARVDAEGLQVLVLDDGPGLPGPVELSRPRPDAARQGGLGLHNSWLRLQQAYGQSASLTLSDRDVGGCEACVRVPMQLAQDEPTRQGLDSKGV